jgi:hypothetical protein
MGHEASMHKWISLGGWIVAVAFAIAFALERHNAQEVEARANEVRATAEKMFQLKLETDAGNARWLAVGLGQLRREETAEGYETLDTLLVTLVESANASEGAEIRKRLAVPRRYLEAVGSPRTR